MLYDFNVAEIGLTYSLKIKASERPQIKTSKDSYEIFLRYFLTIEHCESMYLLLLNRANKVLGIKHISTGGTSGTVCDPKIIFQVALKGNASNIILAHNHPSGNLDPSGADRTLTAKIVSAGKFLDLPLLDHLIVTSESYYSFADEGCLY